MRTAAALAPSALPLLLVAALFAALAWLVADHVYSLALLAVAATLVCLLALLRLLASLDARAQARSNDRIAEFVAHDAAPSFTTDADGRIGYQNGVADRRFGKRCGQTMVRALGDLFANPSAVLHRLQNRALAVGSAREDVVTRQGHVRLSVHQIGTHGFLWRLEEMVDRSTGGRGAESLSLPMLTASKSGTILFMNEAMRRLVGGRVRTLDRIFPYMPLRSGEETEITGAEGSIRALVAELAGASGRREIYLIPAALDGRPRAAKAEFEDLPVALAMLRPDGRLINANRCARDLLGLPRQPDAAVGSSLSALIDGPGRPVTEWLGDAMAGLAESRPQTVRVRGREEDFYVQVTLRRISEDGQPGLLCVLNDATELVSLEAQFTQSQKMQAIGQLAGGVAHDFNNLLTAISGHCDLLLLRRDKGDPDYADLMQIHQNANRAGTLVSQLLAFSRKQTMAPEVLDLRETLADLGHLLDRLVGEKVSLSLRHEPELRSVRADRRQLEQVIVNLVVNARDAMREGGTISIETRNCTLTEELARDRARVPPGDYVLVHVHDEGEGIAPEKRDQIFEPFFTTKRAGEGTGLGLSTAYGIMKQTGGFIFVDPGEEGGTTFTLYLPVCDYAAEPEPESSGERQAMPHGREGDEVILLVEDEAPVRAFASRALRLQGYTVLEAETAEDALETLRDEALHVDMFVTDVVMPGMDGPSWVREALKERPEARVVFVSGYAEDVFASGESEIPNAVFLPKPFSLQQLATTVQRQLH